MEKDEQRRTSRESRRDSVRDAATEPQPAVGADGETTKKGDAPTAAVSPSTSVDSLPTPIATTCVCVCPYMHTNIQTVLSAL